MQFVKLTRLLSPSIYSSSSFSPLVSFIQSEESQLVPTFFALGGVRHKIKQPRNSYLRNYTGEEAVKCHGFTYFPRFPGDKDPPYEPTKLFAVRRIRPLKGVPYWERKIVEGELGLVHTQTVAIVKNTPNRNQTLHKVKHLILITPVTLPNEMPTDPRDGFLKENGEFVVHERLTPIEEIEADVDALRKRDLDYPTLTKRLSLQWQSRW